MLAQKIQASLRPNKRVKNWILKFKVLWIVERRQIPSMVWVQEMMFIILILRVKREVLLVPSMKKDLQVCHKRRLDLVLEWIKSDTHHRILTVILSRRKREATLWVMMEV